MKKATITISYDEEKLNALKLYLSQKGTTVEDELNKDMDTLCSRIYRNEERHTSDKACCSQAKENENFCSLCLGRSCTGEKAE